MNKQKYLPHIDGLRAISVILVILFHFMIGPFTGGYIGVDVFFTISGFLIIGSIVNQLEAGTFSALDFWQRRIRRLIPAILATLTLTLFAGFLIMNPSGFEGLAKQSLFALFSVINFTLLGKVDYFDQSSPDEPLLHFWSLAVEEQFYIFFPIMALSLFFFLRKHKNYKAVMIGLLIVLSIASVYAAEYLIKNGQNLTAYYMMPTRFSQLALGGVLAIALQYDSVETFLQKIPKSIHAVITISGFIAIGFVATKFTVNTAFPGFNSTLPTYGALTILMSGGRNSLKPILENSIASYIGKLSYSLYLVHWPVWAFLAYYLNRQPEKLEVIGALITSFGLSVIIYHSVEKPFRFGKVFRNKAMYKFLIPSLATIILLAGSVIKMQGLPYRIPSDRREYTNNATNYHKDHFGGAGYSGDQQELGYPKAEADFLIIGDSKARQFAYGIDKYLRDRKRKAILISRDGCPMIEGVIRKTEPYHCNDRINKIFQEAKKSDIPIISARGWSYFDLLEYRGENFSINDQNGAEKLVSLYINFHKKLLPGKTEKSRKVYLIGSNAFNSKFSIAECLSRPSWIKLKCLETNNIIAKDYKLPRVEKLLKEATEKELGLTYIPMVDIFCETGVCSQASSQGKILFSDPTHLSKLGSSILAERLLILTKLDSLLIPDTSGISLELVNSLQALTTALEAAPQSQHPIMIERITELMTDPADRIELVNALWDGVNVNQNRILSANISESFAEWYEDPIPIYRIGFAYYVGEGKKKNLSKALNYFEHPSLISNHTLKLYQATIYLDESFDGYDYEIGISLLKEAVELEVDGAIELLAKIEK